MVLVKYPSSIKKKECFIEKKKKIRTFWDWESLKNKNTEPHQIFSGC